MRESMVGENNPSYKEGRRVTMSFRTTEERRAAVKELAQANRCNTSDMLNQLIDTAYDAHNQQTEAFLPASPPPRHRPTPQPAPTPSADDEPTPPPANISFDEAIEILKRNGGVRKLPRRQLWHFGKHKIRLDEDGIIEEAEKYLKRESTPPPPITSSPTKKRRKGGGSAMIDMDTLDDLLEAVAGDMGGSKAEWARLWGDKLKGMIWDEIREGK